MNLLKREEILKTGKKQDIPYYDLANQEGNENIKMIEIENILLYSGVLGPNK